LDPVEREGRDSEGLGWDGWRGIDSAWERLRDAEAMHEWTDSGD
jgi:hypothetical protein